MDQLAWAINFWTYSNKINEGFYQEKFGTFNHLFSQQFDNWICDLTDRYKIRFRKVTICLKGNLDDQ